MQGFSPPSTFALSGKHRLAPSRFALRPQQNQRIVFAFSQIDTLENVETADNLFDYPMMIKSRRQAYDGRGNAVPHSKEELASVVAALGGYEPGLYAERWTSFTKELLVIVARERDDSILCYPVVETIHIDNIGHIVEAPADVPEKIKKLSVVIACRAVNSLKGAGVFAVELFLTQDGQVLLNEVSPRPHNNGHHTIESCYTSQYEQHLRAVLGLPLGETSMKTSAAIMYNILGEDEGEQGFYLAHQLLKRALNIPGAIVHWYDKPEMRWLQKIGHMTIVGPSRSNVRNHMDVILNRENIESYDSGAPQVAIIMESDSDLPTMKDAADMLSTFHVPFEITIVSAHRTPKIMYSFALSAKERGFEIIIAGAGGAAHLPGMVASLTTLPVIGVPIRTFSLDGMDSLLSIVQMPKGIPVSTVAIGNAANAALLAVRMLATKDDELWERLIKYQEELRDTILNKAEKLEGKDFKDMPINFLSSLWIKGYHTNTPQVSIIVGSDSDLPIMKDAAEMLSTFRVPFEITIVSAYRTLEMMYSFALSAKERDIEIIIAGDGGATHLPGMVASLTQLPVIGVPIGTSSLDGMSSLWSIMQMPKGIPVATVAIENAANAALLAVRMLATKDGELWERLIKYQEELRDTILNKAEKLKGFKDMTINYQRSLWIKGYHTGTPQVSIIMGSDSDLTIMKDAAEMLSTFHVPFEITIISAHRTPGIMYSFSLFAKERGIEIIIAGDGGAAHLPGMMASLTQLPVIGVPIGTPSLDGMYALWSIVQMPKGIPVATVAIGNATNAALLAVRMLAIKDGELWERLIKYQEELRDTILNKAEKLEGGEGFKDITINYQSSLWIKGYHTDTPQVAIIMGSDSDLPTMKDAAEMLNTFHVPFEITIVSAHRTPERMYSFAVSAKERGIEIIIAGAGGAAHLPGMVASLTQLPVIGVPIRTSSLDGVDSLLSIVQMPKGIPVATVAIGNAANAALLAVRILATKDGELRERLIKYQEELRDTILNKT